MKNLPTPKEALVKLQELCARSEQCSSDIRERLYKWNITQPLADKIITLLIKDRYIDDSRFARGFVCDKYRFSGWGIHKISTALTAKKIPRNIISTALKEIDQQEYRQKAFQALNNKARSIHYDKSYEAKVKLWRFGASRGFESALLNSIIKELPTYVTD